ncbi:hypothetical protein NEF87_002975 [Candidatus Lokiarchaeum ossiferum]|uniref:Uncharacterized protein n=1 Tax=Candidatus Lokiarchaeum ossiferum TaxID=2951803 RepID=A0ABY6HT53_9ARCH|nr:hypothetical protein NEF87_002975 [Candidatus Lokiarchaeum sp. B-35]
MGALKEILKSLRRKKNTKSVKICPQCKQASIYRVTTGSWVATEHFRCRECDYEGAFYLEVDPEEDAANFADLEKLKQEFPDDLDPDTDLDISKENLQNILVDKSSKDEQEKKDQ